MDRSLRRLRPVGALLAAAALVAAAGASARSQDTRVLRVSKVGEGVVAGANGRLRCGTHCSAPFAPGARITLTATPARFFAFQRWTGGCIGTAPKCVVFLDRAASIRAVFARKTARVALAVSGPGNVVSEASGPSCGSLASDCTKVLPQGVAVTLTPSPEDEASFGQWGGACRQAGSGACQLVPEGDVVEVLAAFRPDIRSPDLESLFVTVEGETKVASMPAGIDCPTTCDAEFPSGTVVTLRAVRPQTWDVSCVGETTECLLILDDTTGVGATDTPVPPTAQIGVNVTVFGRGAVRGGEIKCGSTFGTLLDCEGLYTRGTTIVLQATARGKARFVGWSGACTGKKRRCSLTVNAPRAVYATFRG
jgi:hypothetical protein